jgi:hypothetical protein
MKHSLNHAFRIGFILQIAVVLASIGCGSTKSKKRSHPQPTKTGDVSVDVKLQSKDEISGLALLTLTNYTAEIVGCKSGLSFPLLDSSSANVKVLNADRDCVFEMRSFSMGAEDFDMNGKSFIPGSIFQVIGDQGSVMEFTVISNLENPIDGDQLVRIIYGIVQKGDGKNVDASVNAGIQIEGALPLGLEIKNVALAIDAADGAGLLSVVLECDEPVNAGKCMDIPIAGFKAGIAKDVYSGSVSLQQCLAIANAGSATSPVAVGNATAPNGGISSQQLKGVAPLFGPGNNLMILAVAADQDSCKYYEVEILKP